ncbi:MAG: hypothetical protein FGM45_07065 [Actinobacteria bacterium]|nr:hypothetical protein [Actinomycetota bacterium]
MKTQRLVLVVLTMVALANCGGSSAEPIGRIDSIPDEPRPGFVPESDSRATTTAPQSVVDGSLPVEWGFAELMAKRIDCSRDPWSCDIDDLAVSESPAHHDLTEVFERRRRYGITASTKGALTYEVDAIHEVSPELAHVSVCINDDVVLTMRVPGGGPPAIFDESISSYRMVFVTQRTMTGWRWVEFETVDRIVGLGLCDAS